MKKLTAKQLLFVDGIGAAITAIMLSQVLARVQPLFGMPLQSLHLLAIIAIVFALYSFSSHFLLRGNWNFFLKMIALANGTYCLLTLGLMVYYSDLITWLGLTYFLGEIIIVMALVRIEWKASREEEP